MPSVFMTGYDTLACCFGEELFYLVADGKCDCPGCGTRRSVEACQSCQLPSTLVFRGSRWASVKTEDLLASGRQRFFFPMCFWKADGEWISATEMAEMYNWFKEEISHV